ETIFPKCAYEGVARRASLRNLVAVDMNAMCCRRGLLRRAALCHVSPFRLFEDLAEFIPKLLRIERPQLGTELNGPVWVELQGFCQFRPYFLIEMSNRARHPFVQNEGGDDQRQYCKKARRSYRGTRYHRVGAQRAVGRMPFVGCGRLRK